MFCCACFTFFSFPLFKKWTFIFPNHVKVIFRHHDGLFLNNYSSDLPASLVVQTVKTQSAMQETRVWSLGWEDALEKGIATHSCILAWRIPWREEPCRLQSVGSQRVTTEWSPCTHTECLVQLSWVPPPPPTLALGLKGNNTCIWLIMRWASCLTNYEIREWGFETCNLF